MRFLTNDAILFARPRSVRGSTTKKHTVEHPRLTNSTVSLKKFVIKKLHCFPHLKYRIYYTERKNFVEPFSYDRKNCDTHLTNERYHCIFDEFKSTMNSVHNFFFGRNESQWSSCWMPSARHPIILSRRLYNKVYQSKTIRRSNLTKLRTGHMCFWIAEIVVGFISCYIQCFEINLLTRKIVFILKTKFHGIQKERKKKKAWYREFR